MEIQSVQMALITNLVLVLLILYVQPVFANSTVMTSTGDTSESNMTTMSKSNPETLNTTLLESTDSPSTTDETSSNVTESETTAMSSIITVTSSMSTSSIPEMDQSTQMTTMSSSTTQMPSTVLPSPPKTMSTVAPMETTTTSTGTYTTIATAGPALGQGEIIAIGVGGGVLLLVLFVIAAFCIYKKCSGDGIDTRPISKIDEDDCFPTRMSMHRPESSTMNADGDLAFLTFTGKHNDVDGIVNPTYDTTVIDEYPNQCATIPSKARLSQNPNEGRDDGKDADDKSDVEGVVDVSDKMDADGAVDASDKKDAAEGDVDAFETEKADVASESSSMTTGGETRPISGVSYKSADIDFALEVLDVGTV